VALVAKAGLDFGSSGGYWSSNCDPLDNGSVSDVNIGDGNCVALVVVAMNVRLSRCELSHGASGEENVDRSSLHLGQQEKNLVEMAW